eukprot:UN06639
MVEKSLLGKVKRFMFHGVGLMWKHPGIYSVFETRERKLVRII